jgi:hypothetical protein
MRQTKRSTAGGTGDSLGTFRRSRSLALWPLGVVLFTTNVYGQNGLPSSSRELLATDPRAFVQWLESNRPDPISAQQKAAILSSLPRTGEVKSFGGSSRRKLAGLNAFLRQTGHDRSFEIKVIDVAGARIVLYERTLVLIAEPAFNLLGVEELQAALAHEIGHQYLSVAQAREPPLEAQRGAKDVELLCDAVAIVLLRDLEIDSARLVAGIEKITKYNRLFDRNVEERAYPSIPERRKFAREVAAWLRASPPRSSR